MKFFKETDLFLCRKQFMLVLLQQAMIEKYQNLIVK